MTLWIRRVREALISQFLACYGILLTAMGTPADGLLGRVYREVSRNRLSVPRAQVELQLGAHRVLPRLGGRGRRGVAEVRR